MADVFFKRTTLNELLKKPDILLTFLDKSKLSLKLKKRDFLGIKIHFGEEGNKSYLNPKIIKPLIKYLKRQTKPFFFDTNTLYRGQRMNSIDHLVLASQHGFHSLGIPVMVADGLKGNDYVELEIDEHHFDKCFITALWKDVDFILCLSHFTLHMLTGFGAAIKNLGMGLASKRGKLAQHCEVSPRINEAKCVGCGLCAASCPAQCIEKRDSFYTILNERCIGCAQCINVCPQDAIKIIWSNEYNLLQEKMVEYAYAATKNKPCAYFNFCIFITKECDCMNKEKEGFVEDLGVFFSYDPVAIDKASIDLLIQREKKDILKEIHPEVDYTHQFRYAQEIGLGSTDYNLIEF